MAREQTTRRSKILAALAEQFKAIDGTGNYKSDLGNNVEPRMQFWDEIDQFPAVHMAAGSETREYYGGGNKWRFLTITVRCYVNSEDPVDELEEILEDLETVLDNNPDLTYDEDYGEDSEVALITLVSIDTDEGALAPLGVGEMILEVRH